MRPPSRLPTVLSQCRRTQARPFHSETVQNQRAQSFRNDRHGSSSRPRERLLKEEPNSAVVRGKKFLSSPAEALAVIRAVERKYGAVREYRFTKDFELPSHYQIYVNVAFRDPNAFERIPLKPEPFTVTLPSTIANRPGGIGLDELQAVLQPQEYVKSNIPSFGDIMETVEGDKEEELTFTIERAELGPNTPKTIPTNADATASTLDWEPLPGHESAPTDTPMPSAIQAEAEAASTSSRSRPTDTTSQTISPPAPPIPSTTSTPVPVNQAETIASQKTKPKKHKAPKRKVETPRTKATSSLRDLRTQALQARQNQPPPEASVKGKISSFFSNIF
ncbi:hypothetical protein DXG03_001447 [Asterophora parasitica]|uniref:Uncharacterized protein n=1 Tax=Asterophora parasitica TaxID=117018 RepID=A0A9P7GH95_9AGAR|nr:hypothetical protein DXG03_001447 [Asterophora parasitica]